MESVQQAAREAVISIQEAARTAIGAVTAVAALDAREGCGAEVAKARADGTASLAWQDLCALTGELAALVTAGRSGVSTGRGVAATVSNSHHPVEQDETDYCQKNRERDA